MANKLRVIFDLESSGRLMFYSAVVGMVAGLGAAAFYTVLKYAEGQVLGVYLNYQQPPAGGEMFKHFGGTEAKGPPVVLPTSWWKVLLVPAAGGLLVGALAFFFAPEAEGDGTDAMINAFHRLKGVIRARVPFVKAITSILTISTGGSAGREGPISQIGAGFGSALSGWLRLPDSERRLLMLAGTAGGLGAIFQAPVGGALFAVEVLYCSAAIEFAALVPAVLSSVVAFTTFRAIVGEELEFVVHEPLKFHGAWELPMYLLLAALCAVVGALYVSCLYTLRDRVFHKMRMSIIFRPALGGLLMGVVALALPQVMAGGYGWIQQAIDGHLSHDGNWFGRLMGSGIGHLTATSASREVWTTVALMALIGLAKIVATSLTVGSGGSGGVFAPSLFIGAMLGGAFGLAARQILGPEWVPQPAAYVLVGMGGFFAGVAKVPLTSLVMVSEMCGSYGLLMPLMLVTIINMAVLSSRWKLYEQQVTSLIDSPAHLGDFVVDVLARIQVRDVYHAGERLHLVPQDMPISKVMHLVAYAQTAYFPVVDRTQQLVGIFTLHDVRAVQQADGAGLILAADIATTPVLTVTPDDDLHTALRRFTQKNIDELPVVDAETPTRILGMLRRKEVIGAYDRQLDALRNN